MMATRTNNYQYRKDIVMGIVIDEYVKTITPVSSSLIARDYSLDLSSATIRNIMAELEQDGYLAHPHTSAGRVPTQEGYRYYVDNLMSEINLLEEEKKRIHKEYQQDINTLESVLERTSQVISDLTHYTGIISLDGRDRMFCRGTGYVVDYTDFNDIEKIRNILRTIERKERILKLINRQLESKIDIYIGHELAWNDMEDFSLAVSSYRLNNGQSGRIAILGPTRMNYQKVVSALDYVSSVMHEMF